MVWQSLPTSTHPSDPSLRISLSKPSKASNVYNWLQGVNEPLQQRDYLPISSLKCLTHSNTHNWDEELKIAIKTLLKSRYTNWRTKDHSRFYDLWNKSSINVVCFFIFLARELENELDLSLYSMSSKLAVMHILVITSLLFMESG